MPKLIKALFGVYVLAAVAAAFPGVASAIPIESPTLADVVRAATSAPNDNIRLAVVKGSALIDSLKAGILGGPTRTVEVAADEFQPTHIVPWGCRSIEDILDIASPIKEEFRQGLVDKINERRCFFFPGGVAVQRLEIQTVIPAEGDRPIMVIWSMVDRTGSIAYGSWAPDDES